MNSSDCPCQSGKQFKQCCQPYLTGKKNAPTPSKLMRSRFSAFSLGGFGQYLLSTWHPDYRGQLSAQELSFRSTDWQDLEIIAASQQADAGTVEFIAHFKTPENTVGKHHELSNFVRVQGQWLYCDGTVTVDSDTDE